MSQQLERTRAAESTASSSESVRVAIIGSGFSGLGMAIRLKQEGIDDFAILERSQDLGGTWYDNTYPGCACDVPSHLYSFSFAPNPEWTHTFSPQPEIWQYLRNCSDQYAVTPHIRFGCAVEDCRWDEGDKRWKIQTSTGTVTAQVVVAGVGPLSEPATPSLSGMDDFEGTSFHSARWQHDHDLTGRRVAVVGTGASAIQFVPRIQSKVESLHIFQRTPPWVMPHPGRSITETERKLFRRLPSLQLLVRAAIYWGRETFVMPFMHPPLGKLPERIALRHMRRQVPDPKLREKLEPDYKIGCKRILPSNDYYPALTEPNVELVTDPIRSVRSSSIVTEDGTEREVDTIIFGTGFRVTDMPVADHIRGRSGTRLADVWHKSPQAYLGTSIAGFPNLFMLIGPNTGLGHNSMVFMIESQLNYIMDCLNYLDSHDLEAVEVRESAQAAFNQQVQGDLKDTVWTVGGCSSWYLDHTGRNTTLWPGFTWRFRRQTRRFDVSQYITEPSANGSGPQRMKSSKQAATKRQKPLARRVLASAGGLALAGTLAALAADRLRR